MSELARRTGVAPRVVPRLLTAADIARDTGLCTRTVHRLRARGELPAVRMGDRQWRFPHDGVLRWIEQGGVPRRNGKAPKR